MCRHVIHRFWLDEVYNMTSFQNYIFQVLVYFSLYFFLHRETALLIDPKNSCSSSRQWVALVVGHELAHQWFGNLVTMVLFALSAFGLTFTFIY